MIISIRHPFYDADYEEWCKWRMAYEGGKNFIYQYLRKLSRREGDADFADRKTMSYCPAFAAAAIDRIKDAIYQRMVDVKRVGGPQSYLKACEGQLGGVDFSMSTMNTFTGTQVLPELLSMKRVGVLIDNAASLGSTIADKEDKHPYLGLYKTEAILSWSYMLDNNIKRLSSLLLQENVESIDPESGLPFGTETRYRLMKRDAGGVSVTFYDEKSNVIDKTRLENPNIPFVIYEIPKSLMQNTADYQIALLNLESADVSYALKSNFPFYYEFYQPKTEAVMAKPLAAVGEGGTASEKVSKDPEAAVGSTQGRRFPEGLGPPGFINPSPETLQVSMEKEQQIKEDIERLVNLNLTQIGKGRQSAESKQEDQRSLDASLSHLGLILAKGEAEIAYHWAFFEGSDEVTKISYPTDYSLKSDEQRQLEANELKEHMHDLPSDTYKRAIAKKIAKLTVRNDVTDKDFEKILREIDNADTLTSDPDQILADHEAGLVSDETASKARGYKEGECEQAKKDRAERIKLTLEAQGGPQGADGAARGAPEFGGATGATEKIDKPKRGEGKAIDKEKNK